MYLLNLLLKEKQYSLLIQTHIHEAVWKKCSELTAKVGNTTKNKLKTKRFFLIFSLWSRCFRVKYQIYFDLKFFSSLVLIDFLFTQKI